jgi:hypothetical protein
MTDEDIKNQVITLIGIDVANRCEQDRKHRIEEVLPESLRQMLEAAPANETLRTMALNYTRQKIPDDARDYPAIKNWIEFNVASPPGPGLTQPFDEPSPLAAPPPPGRTRREPPAFTIEVDCSENVRGTCSWSAVASGSDDYGLTETELLALADEVRANRDGIREFVESVKIAILDKADENPPDMDRGEEEYDNYDTLDGDGLETSLSTNMLLRELTDWLRDHPEANRYFFPALAPPPAAVPRPTHPPQDGDGPIF